MFRTTFKLLNKVEGNKFNVHGNSIAERQRRGNIILGLGLVSMVFGIYYYTISSISQDDFSEYENEKRLGVKKPKL